ncbi:MAG: hypothetical protein ACREMN_13125 [Gemmatimonadales bacterium]
MKTATAPISLAGGILQENALFVSPEQFLPELRTRRAQQSGVRSMAS